MAEILDKDVAFVRKILEQVAKNLSMEAYRLSFQISWPYSEKNARVSKKMKKYKRDRDRIRLILSGFHKGKKWKIPKKKAKRKKQS
jgi:hypothetical protein